MDNIEKICEYVRKKELKHKDTIIISYDDKWNNQIFRNLVGMGGNYYLVRNCNKHFDPSLIIKDDELTLGHHTNVMFYRTTMQKPNKDSFRNRGTGSMEEYFFMFEEEVKRMFNDLFEYELHVRYNFIDLITQQYNMCVGKFDEHLDMNHTTVIRILLEVLYFNASVKDSDIKDPTIIIEGIEDMIGYLRVDKITEYLKSQFPALNFIFTTQSYDIVYGSKDFNLITMFEESDYMLCDGNDFNKSFEDSTAAISGIYGPSDERDVNMEIYANLMYRKILGYWSDYDNDLARQYVGVFQDEVSEMITDNKPPKINRELAVTKGFRNMFINYTGDLNSSTYKIWCMIHNKVGGEINVKWPVPIHIDDMEDWNNLGKAMEFVLTQDNKQHISIAKAMINQMSIYGVDMLSAT